MSEGLQITIAIICLVGQAFFWMVSGYAAHDAQDVRQPMHDRESAGYVYLFCLIIALVVDFGLLAWAFYF